MKSPMARNVDLLQRKAEARYMADQTDVLDRHASLKIPLFLAGGIVLLAGMAAAAVLTFGAGAVYLAGRGHKLLSR